MQYAPRPTRPWFALQIVFPEIGFPRVVCAHCLQSNMLCQCGGLARQDFIMYGCVKKRTPGAQLNELVCPPCL